jgi:hypothetical protein
MFSLLLGIMLLGCGGAKRALVHDEDVHKVFPWPKKTKTVSIRAMPKTTMANTCHLFGSYKEVEVSKDTTFFITDELGKKFAYTPSRSPLRRLAPVEYIEIRWTSNQDDPAEEDQSAEDTAVDEKTDE